MLRRGVVGWLAVVFLFAGLGAGCGRREPARSTEPDASKRELESLNKARQKEWGP